MIRISYQHNLPEKIIALGLVYRVFWESRRSALSSVGFFFMEAIRRHVEDFPASEHPLTAVYHKKFGPNFGFTERGFFSRDRTPFFAFGKFARYAVYRADTVVLGFGKTKKKQPGRFDPFLEAVMARVQSGQTIPVSDRMRRKIAAGTKGVFALRKTTTTLQIPPRPIEKPVFAAQRAAVFPLFREKFVKALEKRYARL